MTAVDVQAPRHRTQRPSPNIAKTTPAATEDLKEFDIENVSLSGSDPELGDEVNSLRSRVRPTPSTVDNNPASHGRAHSEMSTDPLLESSKEKLPSTADIGHFFEKTEGGTLCIPYKYVASLSSCSFPQLATQRDEGCRPRGVHQIIPQMNFSLCKQIWDIHPSWTH